MNLLNKITVIAGITGILNGCGYDFGNEPQLPKEHILNLRVGDIADINPSPNGYQEIIYTGMSGKGIFSVANGHRNAVNVYLSTSVSGFKLEGMYYQLLSVTPDSLKVKYYR